jgi:N-acetylglucosamine kinase-like BadF-type ATPase
VRAPQHIIVAIDAGGTTTRCAVGSSDGSVLGVACGGPGNHILAGWEAARESLTLAAGDALRAAGMAAEHIDVAVVGSSGVGADGRGRELVQMLLAGVLPAAAVRVTGDMVTALWGALHPPVGVVVCAGTGSVCYGRNAAGETCQVGGWGHVMGDEGSAYDIATRALRAMARAVDGRAAPTRLTALLTGALGARSAVDAALRVYAEPLRRERIAALAVEVVAAAQGGDAAAAAILQHAGHELGLAVATALRTLGLTTRAAAVSFSGSVFAAGEYVGAPLRAAVHAAAPLADVRAPLLPPVGGAFCLGIEALGLPVKDGMVDRLRAGLSGSGL